MNPEPINQTDALPVPSEINTATQLPVAPVSPTSPDIAIAPIIDVAPITPIPSVATPQPLPKKNNPKIQKNWLVNYTTVALSVALLVITLGMGGWVIYLYINSANLQNTTTNAVAAEGQQRILRERLQDAYEKQSVLNDDMVILQDRSLQLTTKYQSQLLKNFRIVSGKPEAIQGQNLEDMRNAEENLANVLKDIDSQIDINAKKKEQLKQEIDILYKQAEEEQARRLNIRDGLRQ